MMEHTSPSVVFILKIVSMCVCVCVCENLLGRGGLLLLRSHDGITLAAWPLHDLIR